MAIEAAIVEFANDAFYAAFNAGDLEQMSAVWAHEHPLVCIHPGWLPLFGREAVLQSWGRIFASATQNARIACHEPRTFLQAGLSSVICYEEMQGGWLIATNNFVVEQGHVMMVHHQAGFCSEPPDIKRNPQSVQ